MIREGLTFDDVLLVPKHSNVESRENVNISATLYNRATGNKVVYSHPIIPANMKTVTDFTMADKMVRLGGLAILHRFMPTSIDEQVQQFSDFVDHAEHFGENNVAVSVGVKDNDKDAVKRFIEYAEVQVVCIDIAHGDSQKCAEMASWIKKHFPHVLVIAGNVATGLGARRLWEAGTDVVKVGVGPGSLCTTRIETGNGVPQLTALMDVASVASELKSRDGKHYSVIADGGIKNAGDIVKALCFSDMVMAGNLFAGTDEAPGTVISIDGFSYKEYSGSSTHKSKHVEGVQAFVPYKGPVEPILTKLLEGLRSGCSYQGSHNLEELKNNPEFIKITNAGLKESHPHDVIIR